MFCERTKCHIYALESQGCGRGGGWQVFKVRDADTRDWGLHLESCMWLVSGNKSTLGKSKEGCVLLCFGEC